MRRWRVAWKCSPARSGKKYAGSVRAWLVATNTGSRSGRYAKVVPASSGTASPRSHAAGGRAVQVACGVPSAATRTASVTAVSGWPVTAMSGQGYLDSDWLFTISPNTE